MINLLNMISPTFKKKIGWAAAGVGVLVAANTVYHELTKFNFAGKVILITGGSRGLGLVLARQLAAKGAVLAICGRSSAHLKSAEEQLGDLASSVRTYVSDVTDREQVKSLIESIVKDFGRIDVIINNAGMLQLGPQQTMEIEDYEAAMKIHFYAPLYAIQAVLPHFFSQGEGRIVNITSIGGKISIPHLLPYSSSKFALVGLSEGMHTELKEHNIHVTTIVPNLMRTGSPRNIDVKGEHEEEYAWFKNADSNPLMSQDAEVAAHDIINAIAYGKAEAILTLSGKVANVVKALAPGWVNILLSLTNRLLPNYNDGGSETKKGYEAESKLTKGALASLTDDAATRNNQF